MIISYRHKFTFVHVTKTAGSSVSVYLARHLGPLDIMIGSWGDAMQRGVRPNFRSSAYAVLCVSPFSVIRSLATGRDLPVNRGYRNRFGKRLGDHATASQISRFDPKAWDRHFKFTFVRNPYLRVVSIYRWGYRDDPSPPGFSEMLRRMEEEEPRRPLTNWNSWKAYTIDNRIAVDFVGRQETFIGDMREICGRIGIPFDEALLTHEKRRRTTADYGTFYKPGDRERVARLFAPEIETFGYRFPGE